jgi:TonB family protein
MKSRLCSKVVPAILTSLLISCSTVFGQAEHPGLKLCQERKYTDARVPLENAVRSKEYSANGRLWNCLGLSRFQASDDKGAQKAFETAVKLEPDRLAFRVNLARLLLMNRKVNAAQKQLEFVLAAEPGHADALHMLTVSDSWEGKLERAMRSAERLIELHPTLNTGYILKADLLIRELGDETGTANARERGADVLRRSVEILSVAKSKVTDPSGLTQVEAELENKQIFADYLSREPLTGSSAPVTPEPGVTPLKITYKQKAQYTDRARSAGVQGTITIAVLFAADGRIANTLLLKRLGYGLDENALRAAKAMRFEPQVKDGKPMSVVRLVTYSFNIY